MRYDAELRLLTELFRRVGSSVNTVSPDGSMSQFVENQLYIPGLVDSDDLSTSLKTYLPDLQPNTVYTITDRLHLQYTYFLLPEAPADTILVFGPYLENAMSEQMFSELADALHIAQEQQTFLQKYFSSLPIITQDSHLQALLALFYELLWGQDGFTYAAFNKDMLSGFTAFRQSVLASENAGNQWNVDIIEKRYAGENAMMDAVRTGNLKKVDMHVGRITAAVFDKRLPDHLRTLKNYCIITNTLLRKAAEQGGVHPVYLDSVSSDFAAKIELLSSPAACPAMIGSMARSYCRLVKNHSAKSYSPAVQKAMICVDTDLTAPLSLRYLADELNINSSYLSSLFKKETGLTVTAYIIRQRINYAKHLLENTRLQIQTVAMHCGLGDVHYFSKLFKKETGVTPREFRQSVQ